MARKYFKSKDEARKALSERKSNNLLCCDEIFKMPKGTRHPEFNVCSGLYDPDNKTIELYVENFKQAKENEND